MTSTTTASIATYHPATSTALVAAGAVAGPLFVIAGFAQLPFREGLDPTKHAFSFLLIGPDGWLQATVFVVVGLLFTASGIGLRSTIGGRSGVVAAVFAGLLGIGLVVAGLNAPQPSFGYPIGAPQGPPEVLTTASVLHGVGFGIGILGLVGLLVTLGVALRRKAPGAAVPAFVAAVLLPVVPMTSMQPLGTVFLYTVMTAAFAATAVALTAVRRTAGR